MDSKPITHNPEHDAMVALMAVGTFQNYVQHADTKVSVLCVVLAGSAGAMLGAANSASPIFAVAYLMTFLGAGYYLAQALRPHLDDDPATSAFGIGGITERFPSGAAVQRDEAWAMAWILAEVAAKKHRYVVRAVPWTAASVMLAVIKVLWEPLTG